MSNSKQIVYLSQSQYAELIANGTITVDGVTVTYNENDIYVTPQAEPVTDVRVAGTSVAANGVANIPIATGTTPGVMKVDAGNGVAVLANPSVSTYGALVISPASAAQIKTGTSGVKPIVPSIQHESTFYGLAKAAGHDEASSTESLGTYTPEAKGAIQQMLGVSDLIAPAENNLVASKAYKVGEVFTANGKLYKATAAIAADAAIITDGANANCEETSVGEGFVKNTDYATTESFGVTKIGMGLKVNQTTHMISTDGANVQAIKVATNNYQPITPYYNKEAVFYGLAKVAGADEKDSTLPVGEYTDTAKTAIRTMLGAVGTTDYASSNVPGLVAIGNGMESYQNAIRPRYASETDLKAGTEQWRSINPMRVNAAAFYGLAKAAGDTTQSASSNAVGVYTDNAKASIKSMLGIVDGSTGTVDISGATPTINAVENTRYVCGEVTSLSFTPPSSGISIVRFTSGSTVTVLTIPSTVKFPEWFDPTALETNTIYEICVTDGEFGAVMSWAL